MMEKVNRKDKAFELFDEGKNAGSPEEKALELKSTTKHRGVTPLHLNLLVKLKEKVRPLLS